MYYVYTLAKPDGTVFYVGKGQHGRMYKHVAEARTGHQCHKCNTIRKLDYQITYTKVALFADEQAAYDAERELVAKIGLENLTNLREGGGEAFNANPATRAKLSALHKGRKPAPHATAAAIARNTGRKHTPEERAKILAANLGRVLSAEHKAQLSAALKGRKVSAEQRARLLASRVKQYEGFIAPDGTEYRDITNLRAFCREHGLNHAHMGKVAIGAYKQHKGWSRIERSTVNAE